MINIPAYCDNCRRWTPSGYIVGNVKGLKMSDNSVPCRFCGRNGARVIEGTFNIIDDVLEIIESHDLSPEERKQLTKILQQAIDRDTPAGKLREIITQEVPKASGLNKFITDGINLAYIIGLIVAILAWQSPKSPPEQPKNEAIHSKQQNKPEPQPSPKTKKNKVGVNAPCICGSGRKSKMCCGSKR